MIQKSSAVLFLTLMLWSGCVYEATPGPPQPSHPSNCGSVTALVNGTAWPGISAGVVWATNGRLNLDLDAYGIEGWMDGYLGIENVQPSIGDTQRVFPLISWSNDTTGAFYMIANGDAVYGSYQLAAEDTSAFVMIDSITKEKIWGRFDSLVLISLFSSPAHPGLPDTVRFTKGKFEACVK